MKPNESEIKKLFYLYSAEDVGKALFALTTWNSNREALVRHRFLYAVFLKTNEESYQKKLRVCNFEDFSKFSEKLLKITPSFPMLEDYLPEGDWGEIKYWHNDKNYQILYGDELSNPYDYLNSFRVVIKPICKKIVEMLKENPEDQMQNLLEVLDWIITKLPRNKINKSHEENVTLKEYWNEVDTLFNEEISSLISSKGFLERFSIKIGEFPKDKKLENFGNHFIEGRLPPMIFVKTKDKIMPMSPRFYVSSFIDSWGRSVKNILPEIKSKKDLPPLPIEIGLEFGKFLRKRVREEDLNVLVSATVMNEKPEDFIFPIALSSRNRIYFFAFTSLILNEKELEQSLIDIAQNITQAKKRFENTISLALHLKQQVIVHQSNEQPEPKFIVVIPHISTGNQILKIPKELNAEIFFGEKLLGLFDEIEDADEFDKFCEFQSENRRSMYFSMADTLDAFGAFRDSKGVIVEGALTPHLLMIDPGWGVSYRFKSLNSFLQKFPNTNIFKDPRSMTIDDDFANYIRISNRDWKESYLYCTVGDVEITVTTPYFTLEALEFKVSDTLAQCLADYFTYLPELLKQHSFFSQKKHLRVFLFPRSLVERNQSFNHLLKLSKRDDIYCLDSGKFDMDEYGVRCVFDLDKTIEKFSNFENSGAEIAFFILFLEQINNIAPDLNFDSIRDQFNKLASQKPGYTVEVATKEISFPDKRVALLPDDVHFKKAIKKIAIMAKEIGLEEGVYEQEDAKQKINMLLVEVSNFIDSEITSLNFNSSVLKAIKEIDTLIFDDVMKRWDAKTAKKRRINYDLNEIVIKQDEKIRSMHRNIRFLIEKLVLVNPKGRNEIQEENFKELIALIDWYFSFCMASDQIHNDIYPSTVSIDDQFKIEITLPDEIEHAQREYEIYLSKRNLGTTSNENLLKSPRNTKEYVADLNEAFVKDLGFSYTQILNLLDVMSKWGYLTTAGEGYYYFSSVQEILKIYNQSFESEIINIAALEKLINFLTLKQENIKKIVGTDKQPELIPTWEHLKRHSRYTIRPLLNWRELIIWGPCSANKSRTVWMNFLIHGKIPVDFESETIKQAIQIEKKMIEDELEKKCFELIRKITELSEPNVQLHRREKGAHPNDLGDYDVLAFMKGSNIVLNIECKHLLPAFCFKDAKRLKEDLFGDNLEIITPKSYVGKVQKRHDYLLNNVEKIFNTLKWEYPEKGVEVRSIFVTKESYLWTFKPPIESSISFILFEELNQRLEELSKNNNSN